MTLIREQPSVAVLRHSKLKKKKKEKNCVLQWSSLPNHLMSGGWNPTPPLIMNCIRWNCRGLGNYQWVRELSDLVKVKGPCLAFLMEKKNRKNPNWNDYSVAWSLTTCSMCCEGMVHSAWYMCSVDDPMGKVLGTVSNCQTQLQLWDKNTFGNIRILLAWNRK